MHIFYSSQWSNLRQLQCFLQCTVHILCKRNLVCKRHRVHCFFAQVLIVTLIVHCSLRPSQFVFSHLAKILSQFVLRMRSKATCFKGESSAMNRGDGDLIMQNALDWKQIKKLEEGRDFAWKNMKDLTVCFDIIREQQKACIKCMEIKEEGQILACQQEITRLEQQYFKGEASDRDLAWNMINRLQELDLLLYQVMKVKCGHSKDDCCSLMNQPFKKSMTELLQEARVLLIDLEETQWKSKASFRLVRVWEEDDDAHKIREYKESFKEGLSPLAAQELKNIRVKLRTAVEKLEQADKCLICDSNGYFNPRDTTKCACPNCKKVVRLHLDKQPTKSNSRRIKSMIPTMGKYDKVNGNILVGIKKLRWDRIDLFTNSLWLDQFGAKPTVLHGPNCNCDCSCIQTPDVRRGILCQALDKTRRFNPTLCLSCECCYCDFINLNRGLGRKDRKA